MISRAAAPSTSTLASLSSRSLRAQGAAARSFATVQEAPPVRHYGGLRDQDRIFTNLYGHHSPDLKSSMKYGGDWHRTKDIVLKGDDWVRFCLACFGGRVRSATWYSVLLTLCVS
jgi:NADH dehydrogenase (ubiquinone) flavoprotein 1